MACICISMRSRTRHTRSLEGVSKRVAWFLIALCAWTLYVWITRVVIITGQDQTMGFKVVQTENGPNFRCEPCDTLVAP